MFSCGGVQRYIQNQTGLTYSNAYSFVAGRQVFPASFVAIADFEV